MTTLAPTDLPNAEHVLVLAPRGRDARLCCKLLSEAGIDARPCATIATLVDGIEAQAGAAIVVEEVLTRVGFDRLRACIEAQEPWSDLPIIVLAALAQERRKPVQDFRPLGNVTWLERPLARDTLLASVDAALRGRRRQYAALASRRRDETELRLAAEFQQRLIGISGHDLRNPLSAIAMAASLLAARDIPDEQRVALARRITNSSKRMERIVSDLGDYSRSRVGTALPLFPRPSDFHRICEDVLDEFRATHDDCVVTYDPHGDPVGVWDADRLKQVLSNLLTNAAKYGSREAPIVLRWRRESADDDLVVEVENRGAPILPAILTEIFEPFRLGKQDARRRTNSLGLGLFITREIVRAHGGTVAVRSTAEEGTVFTFTVASLAAAAPFARTRRVLVIDDVDDNRDLYSVGLTRAGFAVEASPSAEEGLTKAFADPPDIIIMDQMMPGIDGCEATRRLKHDARTADVPVILVTGNSAGAIEELARAAGADDFQVKPLTPRHLVAAIESVLERTRSGER
jgi:signal transduction histidine kinase/ActR/RegA family two-component response regulator